MIDPRHGKTVRVNPKRQGDSTRYWHKKKNFFEWIDMEPERNHKIDEEAWKDGFGILYVTVSTSREADTVKEVLHNYAYVPFEHSSRDFSY